jgi:3-methyladenine DNA glycosylase/8-oxoguanine DNA glycosylase
MALKGIGRWTAHYVLLRGLGRLDVFPVLSGLESDSSD